MRAHTTAEAAAVVDAVEDWQDVFRAALGRRMVHAADEYYLMAGRPFPVAERYEGFPMHEDGIGMARTFELEFTGRGGRADGHATRVLRRRRRLRRLPAAEPGRLHRPAGGPRRRRPSLLRPRRAAPVGILSGELGARVLAPLVAALGRADVRVIPVANEFFGGNTGVTGLMIGADLDARAGRRAGGPSLPAARRLPVRRRPLPRRRHRRRPAAPGRGRRDRRPRAARTALVMNGELPVVAVVGRPNVGKSTLFNRIVGEQAAIVEDRPGITRDRKELEAEWLGVPFRIIDTGGWLPGGSDLEAKVSRQVEAAVRSADVVLFVVDGVGRR